MSHWVDGIMLTSERIGLPDPGLAGREIVGRKSAFQRVQRLPLQGQKK